MLYQAITTLMGILRPEIDLSKSRLETLCLIVVGMVSARSVNLSHLACERPGRVQTASTYRRLQRFFQHVRFDEDWAMPLLVRLLGLNEARPSQDLGHAFRVVLVHLAAEGDQGVRGHGRRKLA